MSTVTHTVVRILRWAAAEPPRDPDGPDAQAAAGPVPVRTAGTAPGAGPPGDPATLVARLAAVTGARLRLPDPPLGDRAPAGLGALLLAAALALRTDPRAAARALADVPTAGSARDLLARHGLVARALAATDPTMTEDFRQLLCARSPLTGLLDHPGPGGEEACRQLLDRLLDDPDGRRTAVTALAAPPATAQTAHWRAGLLRRYRFTAEERRLVYDVYETALLHDREGCLRRTAQAAATFTGPGGYEAAVFAGADAGRTGSGSVTAGLPQAASPGTGGAAGSVTGAGPGTGDLAGSVQWAAATLDWWDPLAVLVQRHPAELRARRMLRGHEPGMRLHRTFAPLLTVSRGPGGAR